MHPDHTPPRRDRTRRHEDHILPLRIQIRNHTHQLLDLPKIQTPRLLVGDARGPHLNHDPLLIF